MFAQIQGLDFLFSAGAVYGRSRVPYKGTRGPKYFYMGPWTRAPFRGSSLPPFEPMHEGVAEMLHCMKPRAWAFSGFVPPVREQTSGTRRRSSIAEVVLVAGNITQLFELPWHDNIGA